MSTNNTSVSYGTISIETEKLKNEIDVGKSVVDSAKKRYAEELGGKGSISEMRALASVQPKKYKLPKKIKRSDRLSGFFHKIKILLGFTNDIR